MDLKRISFAALSLASLVSIGFAGDSRVDTLGSQMNEVGTKNARGTFGARTAPERYNIQDSSHWFVGFDIMYATNNFANNDFVQGSSGGALGGLPNVGESYNVKYDWDWGFKARLGYQFDHDHWDASLRYNWFSSSAGNTVSAGNGQSLIPLRSDGNQLLAGVIPGSNTQVFDFCTRATANGSFGFQTVDLDLSRAYFTSSKLSFRPNVGLRSAWINIAEKVEYTGGTASGTNFGLGANNVSVKDVCKTWGIGPRLGVDSKWHLGHGFSIFGDVSASLLYSYYKINHVSKYSQFEATNFVNVSAKDHQFIPNMDLFLGIRYDSCINDNKQHLGIGLGWDTQYWFSQYRRMQPVSRDQIAFGITSRNMSVQGVSLTVDIDF